MMSDETHKRMDCRRLMFGLLTVSACASGQPPSPAAVTVTPLVSTSDAAVAQTPTPATSSSSPPPQVKPGFIGVIDGSPWSARVLSHSATLADGTFGGLPGRAPKELPREISLILGRAEDKESFIFGLPVLSDMIGKHSFECGSPGCPRRFLITLRSADGKSAWMAMGPSAIEIVKYEDAAPQEKRLSFRFDLVLKPLRPPNAKSRHAVGAIENIIVIDIGGPVGLLKTEDEEIELLSSDHLPSALGPKDTRDAGR